MGLDAAPETVIAKAKFLIGKYNADRLRLQHHLDRSDLAKYLSDEIKWSRSVKRDLAANVEYAVDASRVVNAAYRPFASACLYYDGRLNEMQNLTARVFGRGRQRARAVNCSDRRGLAEAVHGIGR